LRNISNRDRKEIWVRDDLHESLFPLNLTVGRWCWLPSSQNLAKCSLLGCVPEIDLCCHSITQEHSDTSCKTSTSPKLLHLRNICKCFQWQEKVV